MPAKSAFRSRTGHRSLRGLVHSQYGGPDAFGSERSFGPGIGVNWEPDEPPRGSYVDFRLKAKAPSWPPPWLAPRAERLHVATAQWGLGAYERFLCGDGEEWLAAALAAGEQLLDDQHRGGPQNGGWRHLLELPHTYPLHPPWLSSIAQGEAASLLVRLHRESDDERFAAAARRALLPMSVPVAEGGILAELDGHPFLEEYPTERPSFVLNGAIFALWGFRDVGAGLGDTGALARFEELTAALAANLWRWDTGRWSRYDLYPHPLPNLASPSYHLLHIRQLEILERLCPDPELRAARERFEGYRHSKSNRRAAFAHKVGFRLLVPRNAALAKRLPSSSARRGARRGDLIVLCYHAVDEDWEAPLSVTPGRLSAQLEHLAKRGYRGVTLAEAAARPDAGRRVAVTFDDGYRSVLRLAKPILDAHGMPATVFVPTDFAGSERPMSWPGIDRWLGTPHAAKLTPMSWPELGELAAAGWEIGSHSRSHPRLTSLDDSSLRDELEGSRAACEAELGRPCETLAYPYGDVDQRVIEAAMAAGYSAAAALTLPAGVAAGRFSWPRVGVYHRDGGRSFRLKTARPVRRLQLSRGWELLEPAVRRLRPAGPR